MKIKYIIALFALTALAVHAQNVASGFYRVQNYGSGRYAYIYDRTGSINFSTSSADMGAIVLLSDTEQRLTDPASVIYINNRGNSSGNYLYDLEAQGTGVYKIINYYVRVSNTEIANTYWVYEPSHSMYLWDGVSSKAIKKSYMQTQKVDNAPKNKYWSIFPVSASTDEYLGIAPNVTGLTLNGKYYKPYYLGFAMNLTSNGMKAYYVSDIKSDAVIIKEVVGTIPTATPIIVECSSAAATDNRVTPLYTSPAAISGNQLKGNFFCYGSHSATDRLKYDANTMRVLAVKDGLLQYVTDTAHEYTTKLTINSSSDYYINANESYLQVPAGSPASLPVMTQEEYDATHSSLRGDVNGDGKVNGTDVTVLYRLIAAGKTATENPKADVNGDGKVNGTDVTVLYRLIAAGAK